MEQEQAKFEGWAKVEVMGHQTHIGFVRTEAYGQAVMFRIDTPGAAERELILEAPEYVGGQWTPAGATVKRAAREGCTVMVGAGSIYRIIPCTEAAAMRAIEREMPAAMKLVSLPERKQIEVSFDTREPEPYERSAEDERRDFEEEDENGDDGVEEDENEPSDSAAAL